MCGIAGFLNIPASIDDKRDFIRKMLGTMEHRGPDSFGYYLDGATVLGSARLSIIDHSGGDQPMSTPDQRHWLVFNGEIYNYLELRAQLEDEGADFRTRCDTEVLLWGLVIWGLSALGRIDGQFAFAWHDRQRKRTVFARDPAGERPLFYTFCNGGLAFASEVKGLFALPFVDRSLDHDELRRTARFWVTLPGRTIFQGIKSLPPGHIGEFNDTDLTVRSYFTLPRSSEKTDASEDEIAEQCFETLRVSVKRRLRADTAVGVYLSGGLDSAITAMLAASQSPHRILSFSVAFDDQAFDESQYQNELVQALGTEHHHVQVGSKEIAEGFPGAIWHAETSVFRTAFVPLLHLSKMVHETGHKVVLTGEGADELFLGYNIFKETAARTLWTSDTSDEKRLADISKLYPYLSHFSDQKTAMLLGFYKSLTQDKDSPYFSHAARFRNGDFAARLFGGDRAAESEDLSLLTNALLCRYPDFSSRNQLDRAQVIEFETLLAGYLLSTQGDRMTAANSVEGRCPFLAPDVIRLAFGIPHRLRLSGGVEEKYILKAAFAKHLPAQTTRRHKQPYRAPDAECFLGEKAPEWVSYTLSDDLLKQIDALDFDLVKRFLGRISSADPANISPRENAAFLIVLSTAEIHRQFIRDWSPGIFDIEDRLKKKIEFTGDIPS